MTNQENQTLVKKALSIEKIEELSDILYENFNLNDIYSTIKSLSTFTNGSDEDYNPFYSIHDIMGYYDELKKQTIKEQPLNDESELKKSYIRHKQDFDGVKRMISILNAKAEKYEEDLNYFEKESGLDVKFTDLYPFNP